jgi:glycogen operon protein
MLLAGDEVLRSQGGNNNGYCQDNALSWFDWTLVESNRDMLRFTRKLIALRRRHACLIANHFFDGGPVRGRGIPDIAWHGARLNEAPWHDGQGRFLSFTMAGMSGEEEDMHVVLNMSGQSVDAPLPSIPGRRWHTALDTSRLPGLDIVTREKQSPHPAAFYSANARSVVVLEARP